MADLPKLPKMPLGGQQLEAKRARGRSHYARKSEAYKARNRVRYLNQTAQIRATNMEGYYRREYGITTADYCRMLREQDGVCAICRLPETRALNGKVTKLHVDHDHTTGRVRGLLCSRCNGAIGYLRDDPAIASNLVSYLLAPPASVTQSRTA